MNDRRAKATPSEQLARVTRFSRVQAAAARACAERAWLAASAAPAVTGLGRILCYHSIGTPTLLRGRVRSINDVGPARFRRHIELALADGYRFVAPEQIARTGGRPGELAVTFDDGMRSIATHAAPVLAEHGIPWQLFVITSWADGDHEYGEGLVLDWPAIERLAADGVAIGSHSVTHPNFARIGAAQLREELETSRQALADHLGAAPEAFAIPFGRAADWTPAAQAAALDAGYTTIWSASERRRPAGTVPRTFITRCDSDRRFRAALRGAYDDWEESC